MSLRSGASGNRSNYAGANPALKAGAKGTTVITLDELERIRSQVSKTNEDSYQMH